MLFECNADHNLAFEYHGYQHYEYPNAFHKTEQEFLDAQMRDDYKEQFAAENDIRLLIIPYIENNNLENYIQILLKDKINE